MQGREADGASRGAIEIDSRLNARESRGMPLAQETIDKRDDLGRVHRTVTVEIGAVAVYARQEAVDEPGNVHPVMAAVAIQIAGPHSQGRRPNSQVRACLEGTVADAQQNGHVDVARIGDRQIQLVVAVEVGDRNGAGLRAYWEGQGRLDEGAGASSQQDADVVVRAVAHDQIDLAVAIEVRSDQRSCPGADRDEILLCLERAIAVAQ